MQTPAPKSFRPKPFPQLLAGNELQTIMTKVQQLESINQLLSALLEPELRQHCSAINFTHNDLTLAVDAAAWIVRIKFLAPQLICALQQHPALKQLHHLTFHIQPSNREKRRGYWKKNKFSREHAKMLTQMAEHVNDDKLKKALLKLADTDNSTALPDQ